MKRSRKLPVSTVLQWCMLFKRCQNLLAGHCAAVVQVFFLVASEPTCQALWCRLFKRCCNPPACTVLQWCRLFKRFGNISAGTVLQGCRLFNRCWNLTADTVLQWCRLCSGVAIYLSAPCCSGAGCLSGVGTNLPCTVLQCCRLFKRCCNLHASTMLQWCRLFKLCRNLSVSTALEGCRLFKQCWNLSASTV